MGIENDTQPPTYSTVPLQQEASSSTYPAYQPNANYYQSSINYSNNNSNPDDIPKVFGNIDLAETFHLVSIGCAILSFLFFLFPLEILPACFLFFVQQSLRKQTRKHIVVYRINLIVTILVGLYFSFFFFLITILTYGILVFIFVFILPYLIVGIVSYKTRPKNQEQHVIV